MSLFLKVSFAPTLLAFAYLLATQIKEIRPIQANGNPVIAAAGDIACDPKNSSYNDGQGTPSACQMKATANLIQKAGVVAVLPLGDNQYNKGKLEAFQKSYDPTWGQFKAITRPAVGNHEYETPGAAGYYQYFGTLAGDRTKGYYSYNLGNWHLIALNSNCWAVGGCGAGSPQERWLKADLAANRQKCTLAYWHHPRFSSGHHGSDANYDAFWQALYQAGVEIVLNGHDHTYERFAPQNPRGKADSQKGIRQFVVGTGGASHYQFKSIQPNSQVRNSDTYGILKLTLQPQGYTWKFVPIAGKTFTDTGSETCH